MTCLCEDSAEARFVFVSQVGRDPSQRAPAARARLVLARAWHARQACPRTCAIPLSIPPLICLRTFPQQPIRWPVIGLQPPVACNPAFGRQTISYPQNMPLPDRFPYSVPPASLPNTDACPHCCTPVPTHGMQCNCPQPPSGLTGSNQNGRIAGVETSRGDERSGSGRGWNSSNNAEHAEKAQAGNNARE